MAGANVNVEDIYLSGHSNKEFILIHGYTGGITDFGELPEVLNKRFNATVRLNTLPGHGTQVEDLFGLGHCELLADIEAHIRESVSKQRKTVLIGLSLGAQAALYLATKYKVAGTIAISPSHLLCFPFNLPGLSLIGLCKRTWRKPLTNIDRELRINAVYYERMPVEGLFVSKTLRQLVNERVQNITSPVLFVHARHEKLGNLHGVLELRRTIPADVTCRFFQNGAHNVFFSEEKLKVINEIVSFVRSARLFGHERKNAKEGEKVSAIVPAYNEAERIGNVLKELSQVPSIDEIIVVDDGSKDKTGEIAASFAKALYLRNETNLGKAASMERGVKVAKNDVLFFCDADLIGFRPEHAEAIIKPVLDKKCDMFIGIRSNFMQRAVKAWSLNSGERALRKEIWNSVPRYYKHRYRIEAGLNYYVKHYTKRGFDYGVMDYTQPLKESKYGILWGTVLRWWMNLDVIAAYLSYPFISNLDLEKRKIEY